MRAVKVMLACAMAALLGACSTPCNGPDRLCAPMTPITSGAGSGSNIGTSGGTGGSAALPARQRGGPPPEEAAPGVRTFAVESPDLRSEADAGALPAGPPRRQIRIALLLPLRSETLGQAAEALRAGFMAGYERERDGFAVAVIDTGDSAEEGLASYTLAVDQNDIVVGPLARAAVTAGADSGLVGKPTIALNHPGGRGADTALPPNMLVIGLSIEDEARPIAAWAAAEQPHARALILAASQPWQRRAGAAFAAQWERSGRTAQKIQMNVLNGHLSDAELFQLRARLQGEPGALLFVALDAGQVRQLRAALGTDTPSTDMPRTDMPRTDIPIYGTSSLNAGAWSGAPGPELDGVRLLDLPWQVQRDHPAVMVYPRPLQGDASADMERLYALGIDAFRVAREIALHPASTFQLDGVTGRLAVSFGRGPARFERTEQSAVYRDGVLVALPGRRQDDVAAPP